MFLKTLDRLVLKSFVGPYIFSFFVAEFVLVMQFLWKYIDELVGKGLSFLFLLELVFYYAVTIIPLSVPITILISSVMVYGNMAEKYEISSFKSAGVSLFRVMRPGIILAVFTFLFSLLASNYLKPKANFKFYQSFENVRRQKPSMTIEEGIFNDDFRGFSIRVGEKESDDETIRDVMIYDNSDRSFMNLTTAEKGKMYTVLNGKYFIMELENVQQYRELMDKDKRNKNDATAFLRSDFRTWKKIFDMSEFEFSENTSGMARRKYDLFNSIQLIQGIDTINSELTRIELRSKHPFSSLGLIEVDSSAFKKFQAKQLTKEDLDESLNIPNKAKLESENSERAQVMSDDSVPPKPKSKTFHNNPNFKKDGNNLAKLSSKINAIKSKQTPVKVPKMAVAKKQLTLIDTMDIDTVSTIASLLPASLESSILFRALNSAQSVNEKIKASMNEARMRTVNKRKYVLRLHQIYSWATICIIFMFIGAPLGSIVRKGGYGYPLLIAIVFFMVFIILMIMGEKLNKSESIPAIAAAWLPCLVLFPVSAILSILALGDVGQVNFSWLMDFFARFKNGR